VKRVLLGAALSAMVGATLASDKEYLKTYDGHFMRSIERVGPCKIITPPVGGIRVPFELYPKWSVQYHEEGVVRMELIFDADWCVRKATIVQSTGYWRLDEVSLNYMMTVRYTPKPEGLKETDGQPSMVVRLGWGASSAKKP
jgi:Gram-negative bacterial TonB protein C-terminal